MTSEEKLKMIGDFMTDVRELKQILVAKDIGVLTKIEVLFIGDDEPTPITIGPPLGEWIDKEPRTDGKPRRWKPSKIIEVDPSRVIFQE